MKPTRTYLDSLLAATFLAASAAIADQATVYVATEAQIRQTITTDIDEAGQGYMELKASTAGGTSSGRRTCYFQFDLTGQAPNTSAPATFSVYWYVSSGRQRVKLWALDQAYVGFSAGLIWDSAQANNTSNDQMLTEGDFTATEIAGTETTSTVWAESPGVFTIPAPWGQFVHDNKIIVVLTGVPDSTYNGGSPARIELGTSFYPASLTFNTTTGNQAPSISSISNQTVVARQTTAPAAFTIGDDTDAAGTLTLEAATSSEDIVPLASIVFGGSGSNRTVTVTGGSTAGEATVTVFVSDSWAQTNQISFTVTVLPDPLISPIPHTNTPVNTPVTIALLVNSVSVPVGNLTLSGVSGNQNLIPDSAITFGGSGSDRTVTVAPSAGLDGVAPISVTVSDGSGTATTSFAVMVLPGGKVQFVDRFDYDSDGRLNLLSADFWAQRTTGTRIVGVTNREATFYGPFGSSYESVMAPLVASPYSFGSGKIFYTSVKAMWIFPPRNSTGPFVHLNNAAGDQFAKVHITTNDVPEGQFRLGIAAGPGANYTDLLRNLDLNTPYRIVTRYDQDAGTTALWIDPTSEASENVTATDTPGVSVEQVGIRNQAGMGVIMLDDLIVSVVAKPVLTLIQVVRANVELDFTAATDDSTSDFTVLRAATVDGVYSEVGATLASTGPGAFRATVPVSGGQAFFKIQRKPLAF